MIRAIPLQPWHIDLVQAKDALVGNVTIEDVKYALLDDPSAITITLLSGRDVVGVGFLMLNEYLGEQEMGVFINPSALAKPKTLLRATRWGVNYMRSRINKHIIATIDPLKPERARFAAKHGLQYRETIPHYWGQDKAMEVWYLD